MMKLAELLRLALFVGGVLAGYYIYIYNQPPVVVRVQIVEKTVYMERSPEMMVSY